MYRNKKKSTKCKIILYFEINYPNLIAGTMIDSPKW